jgi:hypothetical protein
LFWKAPPLQRGEIEARLLARQTDDAIAVQCGLSAAAVGAYHDLFFNVRHALDADIYVYSIAIGRKAFSGLTESDVDIILKMLGYAHGPLMVDAALRYFRNPPALPPRLDGLDAAALAESRLLLQVRVLILTMVAPAQAFVGRKLPPISEPIANGTESSDAEESVGLSVAAFLRDQMPALLPAGPPATLPLDRPRRHDVPQWLSTSLARLCG